MKWVLAFFFSFTFLFVTAFGVNCCYGYVFPQKYQSEISSACQRFGVKEEVVYSVINIESHFRKGVCSSKGAVGLMQLMPSTAQELAREISLDDYDLKNPQHNILIGTYYLSQLSRRFENLETALCAYNAGPANVNSWLADTDKSLDGKTLKKIPFPETRGYLKKFRKNLKYYSQKV